MGDLNGDGLPDVLTVDSQSAGQGKVAVLLDRPDGSFQPPILFASQLSDDYGQVAATIVDLDHDGRNDLIISDDADAHTHVFLGNGDGTFRQLADYASFSPGLVVTDLNGDGKPDVVQAERPTNTLGYVLGNGDGTFQDQQTLGAGQSPVAIAVTDFDGDGIPDAIVADTGADEPSGFGPAGVIMFPGQVDDQGSFDGFGDPVTLASPTSPIDLKVADVNQDGKPDVVVVTRDGILVIFGKQPPLATNVTQGTARNLGAAVHIVQPMLTITPGHEDAWYRLQVPTEVVAGRREPGARSLGRI